MITLANNKTMPAIGLGTWHLEKENVKEILEYAVLEAGYRHIDCAAVYKNEKEIGEALHSLISSGKIKREELFITSKLWNEQHDPDQVEKACKKTLADLQLEYLDLYLMHWGISFVPGSYPKPDDKDMIDLAYIPLHKTWKAMESLVDHGLVKSLGVANFTVPMIIDLLSYAQVTPVINQVEVHPYNTQENLVSFCQKQGIQITAYSPLGSSGSIEDRPLSNPVIEHIAKQYDKTPAQIILKWLVQRKIVIIPKSSQKERVLQNKQVDGFTLSYEEMHQINELNKHHRFVDPSKKWGVPYFE